ncbi:EAL domain-containing protein [Alicyclobacillus fastidiosus]|uniref:EAL domain-containing protein n=1 Tax=Alicyclobacillus fastidiosus TaxID=392011 RepID=A0ABV5AI05_9BACL|nr:EAL domain-containing protein [Alicyclobacillus fastidiosus]WEH10094.1 EAL domain-containing protein [Alicyclobacillus fastidiosus]
MLNRAVESNQLSYVIKHNMYQHFYQPLYRLQRQCLVGYEALLRSEPPISPEGLFRFAEKTNRLYQLDTESILLACASFSSSDRIKRDAELFLNIFPSTLVHPFFGSLLEEMVSNHAVLRIRIVFELGESEVIRDMGALRDAISCLHENGFRIAIDDVGKGMFSLQKILELEPDFIKLDRYFASDICRLINKQRMISLFVAYCEEGTQLILEGIETSEDLAMAKHLGVHIGQGFILGRPGSLENVPVA